MTTFDKCKRDLLVDLLKTSHKATYLRENGYDVESYDCLEEIVADYLLESGFVNISPIRVDDVFYEIAGGETYGAKNPRKPYYLREQIASWIEGGIIKTQDGRRICLDCFGTLIFTDKDRALEALNKMNDKAAKKYDELEMIHISDSDMEIVSTENFTELINLFESYIMHHSHINNSEDEILQRLNELRESVE